LLGEATWRLICRRGWRELCCEADHHPRRRGASPQL